MLNSESDAPTLKPFYVKWLDEIGDESIWKQDVLWSGGNFDQVRRWGFSAFKRAEQCEIMAAVESNFRPVKKITKRSPTLWHITSRVCDYTGYNVDQLAMRTLLTILGYRSQNDYMEPDSEARYNISLRAWNEFANEARARKVKREVDNYSERYAQELERYMLTRTA